MIKKIMMIQAYGDDLEMWTKGIKEHTRVSVVFHEYIFCTITTTHVILYYRPTYTQFTTLPKLALHGDGTRNRTHRQGCHCLLRKLPYHHLLGFHLHHSFQISQTHHCYPISY